MVELLSASFQVLWELLFNSQFLLFIFFFTYITSVYTWLVSVSVVNYATLAALPLLRTHITAILAPLRLPSPFSSACHVKAHRGMPRRQKKKNAGHAHEHIAGTLSLVRLTAGLQALSTALLLTSPPTHAL